MELLPRGSGSTLSIRLLSAVRNTSTIRFWKFSSSLIPQMEKKEFLLIVSTQTEEEKRKPVRKSDARRLCRRHKRSRQARNLGPILILQSVRRNQGRTR